MTTLFDIGDEVKGKDSDYCFVITAIDQGKLSGIGKSGRAYLSREERWEKTGRHFPEVKALLAAISNSELEDYKMSKYVPYHAESVEYAKRIVTASSTPTDKYRKITEYVKKHFVYDYIRAGEIPKKNGLPDVARTWETKLGICLDISAMTTGMLKAVGLDARLCIGYADKNWHAWVETKIGNRMYRFDHSGKARVYKTERMYK